MNMYNLNKPQKLLLAAVGLLILFFQFYKFNDDGIEGTGWVISLVAAGLLLLPVFSLFPERSTEQRRKNKETREFEKLLMERRRAQNLFEKTKVKAVELQDAVVSWLGLHDLQDVPGFEQTTSLMQDQWLQYCMAYVVSLAATAEFKRDPHYLESDGFTLLRAQTAQQMVAAGQESAKRHGLNEKFDPESAKSWAIRDLNEAKDGMLLFINAMASGFPNPDTVLLDYMIDKLGVPETVKTQFNNKLRSFTRQALIEFSAK